jgi:hypothetical protein
VSNCVRVWGGSRIDGTAPSSPPCGPSGLLTLRFKVDDDSDADDKLKRVNDNAFVAQKYNYLSLCSPAIARDYEPELTKVSRVPLAELHADDGIARDRYLLLGPGEPSGEGFAEEMTVTPLVVVERASTARTGNSAPRLSKIRQMGRKNKGVDHSAKCLAGIAWRLWDGKQNGFAFSGLLRGTIT